LPAIELQGPTEKKKHTIFWYDICFKVMESDGIYFQVKYSEAHDLKS
jgi:hypothetical protein